VLDSHAIAQSAQEAAATDGHAHAEHPLYLRHHFNSIEQQADTSSFAMWLFLLTEVMFFGGMFVVYLIYRNWYYSAFVAASRQLSVALGGVNSALLISSSFTMTLAVWNARMRRQGGLILCLLLTFALGAVFLGIKGVEYKEKFEKHHVPGEHYRLQSFLDPASDPVSAGTPPLPLDAARHTELFFALYFAMTGMHALHMIVGMGLMAFIIFRARSGAYTAGHTAFVEYSGLYWHFVDIIWIFLFPLLYLINRH
jgi:cytochrome c oxidase subunit 3